MIKIGLGLGSVYFSARNAGSAGGPATLIDAVFASSAGEPLVDGLYIADGTFGGRTRYTNANAFSFVWNGVQYRISNSGGFGDIFYTSGDGLANPWDGTYTTAVDGTDPPPTVRQATTADS